MSRSRCMGVMGCHGPSWWRVRYCGKYCQGANCLWCSSHLCQVDSSTLVVLGGGLPWSVGACVVRQWNGCPSWRTAGVSQSLVWNGGCRRAATGLWRCQMLFWNLCMICHGVY